MFIRPHPRLPKLNSVGWVGLKGGKVENEKKIFLKKDLKIVVVGGDIEKEGVCCMQEN